MSERVKFFGDRYWWDVRTGDDRFTILTRQATFHPKGVLCYTIIDKERDVRGPCNLIGGGWGDGTYDDRECAELLEALQNYVHNERIRKEAPEECWEEITEPYRGRRWIGPDLPEPTVEVSYRNNVPVNVDAWEKEQ